MPGVNSQVKKFEHSAMDIKNFIYLSDRQRTLISAGLIVSTIISVAVVLLSLIKFSDPELRLFGFEIFKLTATASGIWILVLLHTSSNSAKRINEEIDNFLTIDLERAFKTYVTPIKGFPLDPLNTGLQLSTVVRTTNSAIYRISKNNSGESLTVYFYCRITLGEIITLFYLPSRHQHSWEDVYQSALEFWSESKISFSNSGVHSALWHPEKQEMLEIRVIRPISKGFLFEAAERLDLSEKLIGDARALLLRSNK
jgi:hypothetical protein